MLSIKNKAPLSGCSLKHPLFCRQNKQAKKAYYFFIFWEIAVQRMKKNLQTNIIEMMIRITFCLMSKWKLFVFFCLSCCFSNCAAAKWYYFHTMHYIVYRVKNPDIYRESCRRTKEGLCCNVLFSLPPPHIWQKKVQLPMRI